MMSFYVRSLPLSLLPIFAIYIAACKAPSHNNTLNVLVDPPPVSLNPRATLDATGQRLNALMFRGLTRIDHNLTPQPDLAERWEIQDSGRRWVFKLRPNAIDQSSEPITPERMALCLENYRIGKPVSLLLGGFPHWKGTRFDSNSVTIELTHPDPYLARNVSLLRYFRVTNPPGGTPCTEPDKDNTVIASGQFRPQKWEIAPEAEFTLIPINQTVGKHILRFNFVKDENAKLLKLLRGEVDVVPDSLSLTKTRWLERTHGDRFHFLERTGVRVSYLTFNQRDPILANKEIRKAIAEAIDRNSIIQNKMLGFGSPAGGLLSPLLPESHSTQFSHDPIHAEKRLDAAGFPRRENGVRFRLHYKTTPVREGIETALMIQEMLRKIGIDIVLDVVEPAVFLASIRKGAFQLYSSRWLGIADGSILYHTLHTGQSGNRAGYSNPKMDELLDNAIKQPEITKRKILLDRAQDLMAEDLPYYPLWFWSSTVIIRKGITGLGPHELSLSGALEPLRHLRYQ